MSRDIHDSPRRLTLLLATIERDRTLSRANKKLIYRFKDDCHADGLKTSRIVRLLYDLRILAGRLGKGFDKATVADVKKLVATIELSDYADWTKYGLKVTLKKFYKWLSGGEGYPEQVRWIRLNKRNGNHRLPEELLTEEDVTKLLKAARNHRDRALVAVLYDSGCRAGELLSLKLKNVTFDQWGAQVQVFGKTGSRRVRLIMAAQYLTQWLNRHPAQDDPESYLWVARDSKPIGYRALVKLLADLAERAEVKKKSNPHNFRHSRATFLANHLTEAQMKEHFGWVQSSDMASVYVHLSGRDVDRALLQVCGINTDEKTSETSQLQAKACPRCQESNLSINKFCQRCGMVLDKEKWLWLIRQDSNRQEADDVLDRLLQDQEFKRLFVDKVRAFSKIPSANS